ncbi:MAG: hypothetical protein Q7J16_06770 [Candidatus Cloacimonadales bacterium]|nr:hypothetical protein [Candidatus Cloacimonadales bacterium]
MVKLIQKKGDFTAKAYWVHDFTKLMDLGGRISHKIGDFSFGSSILWEDFEHDNDKLNYEFDAQYNLLKLVDLSTQFSIIDDGLEQTEDLRAFLFADYSPGFQLPVLGKIKPYIGIDTFAKFAENITFAGINCEPVTNGFIKVEYQISSEKAVEDVFNIQVVYVF